MEYGAPFSAVITAVLSYPVPSLALLFFGSAAQFSRAAMLQFGSAVKIRDWAGVVLDLLAATVVTILLIQVSDGTTLAPNLVIAILLLAHLLLSRAGPVDGRLALIKPDMRLVLLVLLVATLFEQFAFGLYGAALYSGLVLVLDRYLSQKSSDKPAVQDD